MKKKTFFCYSESAISLVLLVLLLGNQFLQKKVLKYKNRKKVFLLKMNKEELIVDSKSVSSSGFNIFILIRFLILSGIVAFGIKILIRKLVDTRKKVELIDRIPGPTSFNFLLGNIPLEIIKYVGADYEASKDMYLSKLF